MNLKRGTASLVALAATTFVTVGLVGPMTVAGAAQPKLTPAYGLTQPKTLGASFPLPKAPPKNEHVCFINDGTTQYADESMAGLEAAAKVLGWSFSEIQANAEEPSSYAAGVTSAAQDGCTGVVVDGATYANYEPAMATAISHHMVVLDANTADKVGTGVTTAVRSSQVLYEVGVATGNAIVANVKKQHPSGKVLIQNVTIPQYQSVYTPQLAGTAQAVKKGCGSRCSIYVVPADITVVLGSDPAAPFVAALQTHPKTNYIVTSPLTGGGLVDAIKQAGLTVPGIVGSQALSPQIKDLQSSTPTTLGWVQTPWTVIGWFQADAFARAFLHLSNTDPWKTVPVPAWYITPKNVSTYVANGGSFPKGYQKMFKSMWKIK